MTKAGTMLVFIFMFFMGAFIHFSSFDLASLAAAGILVVGIDEICDAIRERKP